MPPLGLVRPATLPSPPVCRPLEPAPTRSRPLPPLLRPLGHPYRFCHLVDAPFSSRASRARRPSRMACAARATRILALVDNPLTAPRALFAASGSPPLAPGDVLAPASGSPQAYSPRPRFVKWNFCSRRSRRFVPPSPLGVCARELASGWPVQSLALPRTAPTPSPSPLPLVLTTALLLCPLRAFPVLPSFPSLLFSP